MHKSPRRPLEHPAHQARAAPMQNLPRPCADMYTLTNGNDLIKFVDDAQLRIKGLSTSVYVDPHKV